MPVKSYDNLYVYIIDSPVPEDHGPLKPLPSNVPEPPHRWACRLFEEVISELFGVEVKKIYCKKWQTQDTFVARINAELADKTEKDLVVTFYHGNAGGMDDEFMLLVLSCGLTSNTGKG